MYLCTVSCESKRWKFSETSQVIKNFLIYFTFYNKIKALVKKVARFLNLQKNGFSFRVKGVACWKERKNDMQSTGYCYNVL